MKPSPIEKSHIAQAINDALDMLDAIEVGREGMFFVSTLEGDDVVVGFTGGELFRVTVTREY